MAALNTFVADATALADPVSDGEGLINDLQPAAVAYLAGLDSVANLIPVLDTITVGQENAVDTVGTSLQTLRTISFDFKAALATYVFTVSSSFANLIECILMRVLSYKQGQAVNDWNALADIVIRKENDTVSAFSSAA
ncbi:hypothetical protein H0H92_002952 [Tricholoma furcatifolium]|nr:hypothetical protein H0H92_002952 [Tricholoma furcatifolium]